MTGDVGIVATQNEVVIEDITAGSEVGVLNSSNSRIDPATAGNQTTEITSLQLIDDIVHADGGSTSKGALISAEAYTDQPGSLVANTKVGNVAMTRPRGLHVNLRDVDGKEWGNTTQPLNILINNFSTRSDTFTVAANGTTVSALTKPQKYFSIQVKGTGAAADAWSIILEGSLNNSNFTTIVTHGTADGDGAVKVATAVFPVLYFRSRLDTVTLGGASNIVVTILGTA